MTPTLQQKKKRIIEIKGMDNHELLATFIVNAGWEHTSRKEMKIEYANRMWEDLMLIKEEILRRLHDSTT